MHLNPLAARLEVLLTEGELVSSRLSASMRRRLARLFELGVLTERKAGGGRRVIVEDRQALTNWIDRHYPSGLQGCEEGLLPRAEAVANFRDSKRGRSLTSCPVFLRGFGGITLSRPMGCPLALADLTASQGLAAALIDLQNPLQIQGTFAMVENLEVFMHIENIVSPLDAALWTRGRVDERILSWLATQTDCHVVHAGDYDPVGLDEYTRLRRALPEGNTTLYVPHDFEERLAAYGNTEVLTKSIEVLNRVRREGGAEVQAVLAVMDRHGKGLEQEGLLF